MRIPAALDETNVIHAFRVMLDGETEEGGELKRKFLRAVRRKHMKAAIKASCSENGDGGGGGGNTSGGGRGGGSDSNMGGEMCVGKYGNNTAIESGDDDSCGIVSVNPHIYSPSEDNNL
jgi:hypothetical protein